MLLDQIQRLQRNLDSERNTSENLRRERDALLDELHHARVERDEARRAAAEAVRALHTPPPPQSHTHHAR